MQFLSPAIIAMMIPAQRAAVPKSRYRVAQYMRKLSEEAAAAARGTGKAGTLTTPAERWKFAEMAVMYDREFKRLMSIAPIIDREAGPSVYTAYRDIRAEHPSAALFARMAEQPVRMGIVKQTDYSVYGAAEGSSSSGIGANLAIIAGGVLAFQIADRSTDEGSTKAFATIFGALFARTAYAFWKGE